MKIAELLEVSAERNDTSAQIKLKIAALLAKDAEQQRKIYRLFDGYLDKQTIHPPKTKENKSSGPRLANWWRRNALALILSLVAGLLMFGTTYWYTVSYLLDVDAIASEPFINDITGEVFIEDNSLIRDFPPFISDKIKKVSWDWGDGQRDTGRVAHHRYTNTSRGYKIKYIVETERGKIDDGELRIDFTSICESTISYEIEDFRFTGTAISTLSNKKGTNEKQDAEWAKIWKETAKNFRYHWDFGDGNIREEKEPTYRYSLPGDYKVILTTSYENDEANALNPCTSTDTISIQIPQKRDLPLIPISAIDMQLPDISDLVPHKEYWLYLLLAAIALGLYGLYEFILWRKRRLVLDEKAEQLPPLRQRLRVEMPEINLYGNAYFGKVATMLRARRHSEVQDLNVALTLQKSLKNGGEYPDFAYSTRLEASQYLVLIDEHNKKDHLARFYESLVRELNHRDITAEYYFYDKDPSLCWKKRSQAVGQISIAQLAATFAGYRLIIIGDGEGLLDPHTGELAEYIPVFESWKEKALLSTIPNEDWGRGEDTLAEYFTFLPATEEGWEHLVPQWRLEEKTSPFHWRMQAFEISPPPEDSENQIKELQLYLGEKRFQWLCACAVYPILYYELTLQLGERIYGGELGLESLGHLFRLSWFREGNIPTDIRLKLIEHLDAEHAKTTRAFLMEVLHENPAPEGSLAQKDQQNTLAIYQYLNSERDKDDLAELQQALENLDPEDLEDMVSVKYLSEIKHNPLVIPLPKNFYKGGISLMGTKWKARLASVLALLLLVILGLWLREYEGFKGKSKPHVEASDLNLLTDLDSAYWYHYEGVSFAQKGLNDVAFTSFDNAERLGILKSDRKEDFIGDLWQVRFNRSLEAYEKGEFVAPQEFENGLLRQFPDTLNALPDFIPYFVGISGLQAHKGLGPALNSDVVALSEVSTSLDLLNLLDSSFYQGPDANVFTRETSAYDALIAHLDASGINGNSPKLVELYKKLGRETGFYELKIKTGNTGNAQTWEPEITIQIISYKGLLTARLDSVGNRNRQFEENNSFTWQLPSSINLGEIEGLEIQLGVEGKRGLDDWLIDSVILKTPDGFGPYRFSVNSWIGDGTADRKASIVLIPGEKIDSNNILPAEDTTQMTKRIVGKVLDYAGNPLSKIEIREKFTRAFTISELKGRFLFQDKAIRTTERRFSLQNISTVRVNGKMYKRGELRLDTTIDNRDIPAEGLIFVVRPDITPIQNQAPEQSKAPQQIKVIPPQMVQVPGGTFMMGKSDKKPGHEVQLSTYEIGKHEVTFEEYDLFCEATKREKPKDRGWGRGNRPVIYVSWLDAVAYCNWLSEQSDLQAVYTEAKGQYQINYRADGYRLPTEAEWEFAARGGAKGRETAYAGSNNANSVAWYKDNSKGQTQIVGRKAANEVETHDMSGNVWEWVGDWNGPRISSKQLNPQGPYNGEQRVIRGGAWSSSADRTSVIVRSDDTPNYRGSHIGFRIAKNP